ncbi:formate C-acetyltransferase/glycerol dehydratase family glycyl radical enzyme [Maricurvus nonylphenolicus]|uniref:pyruvate formate lyase family protein n=1 Tax=Maricurvus nonylphenolicus TaxID=1008307 RepID=UPI0036F24587
MNAKVDISQDAKTTDVTLQSENRIEFLKKAVQSETNGACIERPMLWTEYYRNKQNKDKTANVQIAEAVSHVLKHKTVRIYEKELIVGNFTSKRVAGFCYPEFGGIEAMSQVFTMPTRKVNPLEISLKDRFKLFSKIPFWFNKNSATLAFDGMKDAMRFAKEQSEALQYQIYEAGGISHIAPNYEKIVNVGAQGIIDEVEALEKITTDSEKLDFYKAVKISMNGMAAFGDRYAAEASRMASVESDPLRKQELLDIAATCSRVPRLGAKSFYEAVQSMTLAHICIFMETFGETTCPGRIDQFLNPFYEKDLAAGVISREKAKEILGAFCIKLCETIPMHGEVGTSTLGGLTSWEVVTIGGQDKDGNDATNELSFVLLELADELRMRQPNFHVRIHENTPKAFYDEVIRINFGPGSAPAMYNDETIIESMTDIGYSLEDARNYVAIGCVEPTAPGKTLASTDAAMYNMPLAVELALNEGRQFGSKKQIGAKTRPVSEMKTMEDVVAAYDTQVKHQLGKLRSDLEAVEKFHAKHHPTPLSSALLEGCVESGVCSTKGGAVYNFSGIQGCGMAATADSLHCIEKAVFEDGWISMEELVVQLTDDISDEKIFTKLNAIDKFGNDIPEADKWMVWVGEHYSDHIKALGKNTRGGNHNAGVYSNTSHTHFGGLVGALPNGRRAGETFASGFAPENGADKRGTTALLNSMNKINYKNFANGINFNIKLDASSYECDDGKSALGSLYKVFFKRDGMQVQANMLDPKILIEARDNPELHPNLLIRVSGYSAYFNDLSPKMQDEVISRSSNAA